MIGLNEPMNGIQNQREFIVLCRICKVVHSSRIILLGLLTHVWNDPKIMNPAFLTILVFTKLDLSILYKFW